MTSYTIEAEDMHLDGYQAKSNSDDASGGGYIQTWGNGAATTTFNGEAGTYKLDLSAFDENDGQSSIEIRVNGEVVAEFTLDKDLNGNWIHNTLTTFSADGIELAPGDEIEIFGKADGCEPARIDKIDLTLQEPADPAPPSGDPVDIFCEDFSSSNSDNIVSSDFHISHGVANTNGCDDGKLLLKEVNLDGFTDAELCIDFKMLGGGFEEWGSSYGDFVAVEIIDQDGNVHLLDFFTGHGNTLTGSETGQTINLHDLDTLNWDIPDGVTSFQIQIRSDISAYCEQIVIDNVKVKAVENAPDPIVAVDDCIDVLNTEGAGDVDGNVLLNDMDPTAMAMVLSIDGQMAQVGQWIDLADGGRVQLLANGNLDFDADGDFDDLVAGQIRETSFEYSIGTMTGDPDRDVVLDFESLSAGDTVSDQFQGDGVTVYAKAFYSGTHNNRAMVFDADNPTGHDFDLGVPDQGNILIISEDGDSGDPDDNAHGGLVKFEFDEPANIDSITVIDIEESGGRILLYDEHGSWIKTIDIHPNGNMGVSTIQIDTDGVAKMKVKLKGSGALDDLKYTIPGDQEIVKSDPATVTIKVEGDKAPPVAVDDLLTIGENDIVGPASSPIATVSFNLFNANGVDIDNDNVADADFDPDGTFIEVTEAGGVAPGTIFSVMVPDPNGLLDEPVEVLVAVAPNGEVIIDTREPNLVTFRSLFEELGEGETVSFSFDYTIRDADNLTDTATATITVVGENDDPIATQNDYFISEAVLSGLDPAVDDVIVGNAITDDTINPVSNDPNGVDSDPDGDSLTVSSVNGAAGNVGSAITVTTAGGRMADVTIDADGTITLENYAELTQGLFVGQTDTLTVNYTVEDGEGGTSNVADVNITIDGVGSPTFNILFLVDASDAAQETPHAMFFEEATDGDPNTRVPDLDGDEHDGSVFDAELFTVQQFIDQLGDVFGGDPGADVEIGVQTYKTEFNSETLPPPFPGLPPINVPLPEDENVQLGIFSPGDDISGSFSGAGAGEGVAAFNVALQGALDFFAQTTANDGVGAESKNVIFILSDSFGTSHPLGSSFPTLSQQVADLQSLYNAEADVLFFSVDDALSSDLMEIETVLGDGMQDLVLAETDAEFDAAFAANPGDYSAPGFDPTQDYSLQRLLDNAEQDLFAFV